MKNKLSVVISAYNEENKIEDCLSSVKFADEIIVVDNQSNDETAEIAKKYTSNVFSQPNYPMLNINKNFGISKAKSDWILVLDADERVTPELALEIRNLKIASPEERSDEGEIGNSNINGYYIPRKNIIFGKWIKYTGWYPDHQLRLFRKGKGRFPEQHVHEMIKLEGETGYLKENMLHYNYESVSQFIFKLLNIYAPNEANELIRTGYKAQWTDVLRFPAKEFLSRFFAREGYRDGFHGLMLSLLMAFYHLIVFAIIWEKEKFKEPEKVDILAATGKELIKIKKEMVFWYTNEKLKVAKNNFERLKLKMIRSIQGL